MVAMHTTDDEGTRYICVARTIVSITSAVMAATTGVCMILGSGIGAIVVSTITTSVVLYISAYHGVNE